MSDRDELYRKALEEEDGTPVSAGVRLSHVQAAAQNPYSVDLSGVRTKRRAKATATETAGRARLRRRCDLTFTDELLRLRGKLQDADADPKEAMQFFTDKIGKDPEFAAASDELSPDSADGIVVVGHVEVYARRLFRGRADFGAKLLFNLPDPPFVTGLFKVNDEMSLAIYFKDIGTGVVGISTPAGPWKYFRFSVATPFTAGAPRGHVAFYRNITRRANDA